MAAEAIGNAVAWDNESAYSLAIYNADNLLAGLRGHVREALGHRHANYVIQKVVDVMPTQQAVFVAKELVGSAYQAATHRFGCRTVLRLVRHCSSASWAAHSQRVVAFLDEVLSHTCTLCCDS